MLITTDIKDANSLNSATTNINIKAATAPTTGQVLTATSATAATWQTPVGSSNIVTVGALNAGSITSGFGAIDIGGDSLTAGSGTFSSTVSVAPATAATHAVPLAQTIGKNLIINGGMAVAQRGSVAGVNNVATYGGADRFLVHPFGFTTFSGNISQASNGNYSTSNVQMVGATTTGSGAIAFHHRIELLNSYCLKSKTITVSAKAYQETGSAIVPSFKLYKANTANDFSAVTQIGSTVTLASHVSGTYITHTASFTLGATDAVNGLQLTFTFEGVGAVTNKNFIYGEVQLEISPVATAFEHRPYGYELALCQRYYQKSFPIETAPVQNSGISSVVWTHILTGYGYNYQTRFIVPMRVAPTITGYNPNAANALPQGPTTNLTSSTTGNISTSGFSQNSYGGADDYTGAPIRWNWTATSEL